MKKKANEEENTAIVKTAQKALFGGVLYDVEQTARILTISPKTVYCLVWMGRLKGVKIGNCLRFRYKDIAEYARGENNGK